MPVKQWKVKLDNINHRVRVEHGDMVRRFVVAVDGSQVQLLENALVEQGNRLKFKIDGHLCYIMVLLTGPKTFSYDLIIDGTSVETGETVDLPAELKAGSGFIKFFAINSVIGVLLIILVGYLGSKPGRMPGGITMSAAVIGGLAALAIIINIVLRRRK